MCLSTRENIDVYSYRGITIESRKQELSMDRGGSIKSNDGDILVALISNEMAKMITHEGRQRALVIARQKTNSSRVRPCIIQPTRFYVLTRA